MTIFVLYSVSVISKKIRIRYESLFTAEGFVMIFNPICLLSKIKGKCLYGGSSIILRHFLRTRKDISK